MRRGSINDALVFLFFIHSGCRLASLRLWKGRREAVFLFGAGNFANARMSACGPSRHFATERKKKASAKFAGAEEQSC